MLCICIHLELKTCNAFKPKCACACLWSVFAYVCEREQGFLYVLNSLWYEFRYLQLVIFPCSVV